MKSLYAVCFKINIYMSYFISRKQILFCFENVRFAMRIKCSHLEFFRFPVFKLPVFAYQSLKT